MVLRRRPRPVALAPVEGAALTLVRVRLWLRARVRVRVGARVRARARARVGARAKVVPGMGRESQARVGRESQARESQAWVAGLPTHAGRYLKLGFFSAHALFR